MATRPDRNREARGADDDNCVQSGGVSALRRQPGWQQCLGAMTAWSGLRACGSATARATWPRSAGEFEYFAASLAQSLATLARLYSLLLDSEARVAPPRRKWDPRVIGNGGAATRHDAMSTPASSKCRNFPRARSAAVPAMPAVRALQATRSLARRSRRGRRGTEQRQSRPRKFFLPHCAGIEKQSR